MRKDGVATLSYRQKEIILLVGKGLTAVEIAEKLGIAPKTIETQLSTARKIWGARNTVQLCVEFTLANQKKK